MPKFSCKSQIKSKEATDDWTNYQIGEKNLPNHMSMIFVNSMKFDPKITQMLVDT